MHGSGTTLTAQSRSGAIILRHPRWADFEEWVNLRNGSRDALRQWEPDWNTAHHERKSFKTRLSAYRRLANAGTAFPFHVFTADGTMVGACNITDIRPTVGQSCQVGYWIGTPHTRRGFGQAAVGAAVKFAFTQLGLHRVEAAVQPDNVGSVTLLKNAGFQYEGLARGYLKINGKWRDHAVYARLSSD